jgi:hypothetical protein
MAKTSIPQHIRQKVLEELEKGTSYSLISEKWQISKATISRIKAKKEKQSGVEPVKQPISKNEMTRREKIGKSALVLHAVKKADFITENFLDAFGVIFHNSNHLVEIIDHSRDEADSLKKKQEEILENFNEYIDLEPDSLKKATMKADLIFAIQQSIQKINDFFARDMIRIKAVGEMRKHLETFLKLKEEILDVNQVKKIFDAFFIGSNELDDAHYIKYRDKVIELAPATRTFFLRFEGSEDIKSLAPQEEENHEHERRQ